MAEGGSHSFDYENNIKLTEDRMSAIERLPCEPTGVNTMKDIEKGDTVGDEATADIMDPNIVDWDGPNDPQNPRNWSEKNKIINVALISASVLYCNLATTMFSPGANIMEKEFGYDNPTIEILTVTISSMGFAVGPMFIAPLSEVFGRVPIYRVASICYLGFTVGCSRSTNVGEFLVFRLLTGLAASPFMTTGGGTIADILEKEERGVAMAVFTAGPLLGPVLGPIVGGFVTQDLGWRWTFYLILMLAGVVSTLSLIFMRETSSPVILKAKTARLRNETGNLNLRAAGDKQIPITKLLAQALKRPIKFLILSPLVLLTAIYLAFIFSIVMLFYSTFPGVYEDTYHWSVGISGLAYVGIGIGCTIAIFTFGKLSDRLVQDKSNEGKYRAERRMILVMYFCPLVPVGLFIYGWTAYYKVHWIAPIIGTAITGMGVLMITSSCQIYVIDLFGPQAAASALSAITLLRNLLGACLPLAASALYDNLGLGWGNSVLAFIAVGFIAVPFLFYWRGQWLREKFPVKV
ncbi:MFS general substrate transporter [Penicillium angulare]|uniref:MFS general substrate transporter n=1 Tax=Penicillium angulare TaxID=116970 RepID=UPI002540C05C|nr:MFS general substrate transporter [Penicillium angulare]KAJ5280359.1 MFS general substrate transporter [Penicillium angulare]